MSGGHVQLPEPGRTLRTCLWSSQIETERMLIKVIWSNKEDAARKRTTVCACQQWLRGLWRRKGLTASGTWTWPNSSHLLRRVSSLVCQARPPPSLVCQARPPRGGHARPLFLKVSHVTSAISDDEDDAYPRRVEREQSASPEPRPWCAKRGRRHTATLGHCYSQSARSQTATSFIEMMHTR